MTHVTHEHGGTFTTEAIAKAYCADVLAGRCVKLEAFTDNGTDWYVLHVSGDFGLARDDMGRIYIPALRTWYKPAHAIETIRDAIGSLEYACTALDAPSFSTMRANLAELRALLATMERSN